MPRKPPAFRALVAHRDVTFRFSFLISEDWQRLDLESGGAMYVPDTADLVTGFGVEATKLDIKVKRGDLKTLEQGFLTGLRSMDRSIVEQHEAEAIENQLITMEARHTFRDGDAIRKRWVRLLYRGSTQVRLVAQGSSPAEFDYWEPMFFQSMRTFRFGDWWAEAAGLSWVEKAFPDEQGMPEPGP